MMLPMEVPQPNYVIVHYHEIALKGNNRPMFVRQLTGNIREALSDLGKVRVVTPRGRILVHLKENTPWPIVRERMDGVPGIANFAPAHRTGTTPEAIESLLNLILIPGSFASFRVSARRGDKNYALNSMELNTRLGRFVQDKMKVRVDLHRPELTIHVEILKQEALVYFEKRPGPGGLPVGVSGHVLSLISGGIDSPVASYLMMKRGCTIGFIHFHSYPLLSKASQEKVIDLVQHLTRHQNRSRLYLVPFGEIQRQIVLTVSPPMRVVLYRRMMIRIAEETAAQEKARALITGESLGQVASQTLENLTVIEDTAGLPVLRPLIGLDKQEITDKAREIGTFETSIIPDQDCCRLFIPPHPTVRARLNDIQRMEHLLNIPELVKMGIAGMEKMEFTFP